MVEVARKRVFNKGSSMKSRQLAVATVLFPLSFASAEEFRFESGLVFGGADREWRSSFSVPDVGDFSSSFDEDTDDVTLFGRWYIGGLSDKQGPRARAAFVDRASFVDIAYTRSETTAAAFVSNPTADFNDRVDLENDVFEAAFRYVDKRSGWFGSGSLRHTDLDPVFASESTSLSLGVGKYLLDTTALQFNVTRLDIEESDPMEYGLSLSHLGSLSGQWQYAVDLGYTYVDGDFVPFDDAWQSTFSLYPRRDIEFGVTAFYRDRPVSGIRDSYEGFASWFITPSVQISARYAYGEGEPETAFVAGETFFADVEQSRFGMSLNVRF